MSEIPTNFSMRSIKREKIIEEIGSSFICITYDDPQMVTIVSLSDKGGVNVLFPNGTEERVPTGDILLFSSLEEYQEAWEEWERDPDFWA